jgi:dCMP deaminase
MTPAQFDQQTAAKKAKRRNKDLAHLHAAWADSGLSKDPSTQVGARVLDSLGQVAGTGYNGFARGVPDKHELYADRDVKNLLIRHAEANALWVAGADARGGTLYATRPPCAHCASDAVQAGIARVVYLEPPDEFAERWSQQMLWAAHQFHAAGVEVVVIAYAEFVAYVKKLTDRL